MKTSEDKIIQGEIEKVSNGHYLTWDDPETNEEMYSQGEFFFNKETEEFEHKVYDENGDVIYKVVAK